jgi:hypothetical protein
VIALPPNHSASPRLMRWHALRPDNSTTLCGRPVGDLWMRDDRRSLADIHLVCRACLAAANR